MGASEDAAALMKHYIELAKGQYTLTHASSRTRAAR